ncbi:hypothetical protein D0469_06375 [Peribacillus saganii]|uniref:Mannosylglycerate hydrolase MGH1-like glycoside hydrolase domain-containing protein n=1 Tax=Peribacillus saganii TaxID=2303992 RepID=A0A372LQS2_9BACI|nr:trehalase family glycosidase [Peribacillus saganii]RFU70551.1 hypothetical protein D0469_06375 [Peribacillus saganii]
MNLTDIPFSFYGSYMSINFQEKETESGLYLNSLRGKSKNHMNVMKFIPLKNNEPVPYQYEADFSKIVLTLPGGEISICFDGDSRIVVKGIGDNVGIRFDTQPVYNFEYNFLLGKKGEEYCLINSYKNLTKFMIYSPKGSVSLNQDIQYDAAGSSEKANNSSIIQVQADGEQFLCIIEDIPTNAAIPDKLEYDFDQIVAESKQSLLDYYSKIPAVEEKYHEALMLAAYTNWSTFVKPEGNLKRYTMYCSNKNFPGAWSWDHCFNALGLAGVDNDLAWDQMAVLFDHQDELGQIPGSVSDSTIRWNFAKPPVHGYFFGKMMEKMPFTEEQMKLTYQYIEKQINFYLKYKDSNQDGICEYHHGNDSGQDNSTVFSQPVVVNSPDLTAFIIKGMDLLASLAEKFNNKDQQRYWIEKADKLNELFIDYFIEDGLPVAKRMLNDEIIESNAVLPFVSLILGKRLPDQIRQKMIEVITSERFLTNWGIATEAIDSSDYEADAYWRGPIWAPSTLLFVEALKDCGKHEIAGDIAERFCEMARLNGFPENYEATTGRALRDKSFTWTASTFVHFVSQYK